ncbi:hypothetical protein BX666DRAFT_1980516 [Dichotomocladium elegans]|nr:hypothetical protein BX666DRAFT_1980516 [Dichotomocladium elegans]
MAEDNCTICLERLGSDQIAALPCRHVYHYVCLVQWMGQQNRSLFCPNCKARAKPKDIIGPLYIQSIHITNDSQQLQELTNNSMVGSGDHDQLSSREQLLQNEVDSLRKRLTDAQEHASGLSARAVMLQQRLEIVQRINRISDLELSIDRVGSPSELEFLLGLSPADMACALVAFKKRCYAAEQEQRLVEGKLATLQNEKDFYEKKFNKVNDKLQKIKQNLEARRDYRQQQQRKNGNLDARVKLSHQHHIASSSHNTNTVKPEDNLSDATTDDEMVVTNIPKTRRSRGEPASSYRNKRPCTDPLTNITGIRYMEEKMYDEMHLIHSISLSHINGSGDDNEQEGIEAGLALQDADMDDDDDDDSNDCTLLAVQSRHRSPINHIIDHSLGNL